MSSQNKQPNISNIPNASLHSEEVNDLMKSIQNKLSMIACEDSIEDFQVSKLESPKRQYLTATNQKRNKIRMNIQDLQTSNRKSHRQPNNTSSLGQSRIVSRINEMQNFYMQKIQQISSKMASMEFDIETMKKQNQQLRNENLRLRHQLSRKQKQQSQIINRRLQQLKSQLITKFSQEAEQHFQQHVKQMKEMNENLLEERGKRKYLEQEIALTKNQKNNLEEFYRELLQNHRNLIKLDIQNAQKGKTHSSYSNNYRSRNAEQSVRSNEQQQKITIKKKGKKKDKEKQKQKNGQKSNGTKRSQQLTKQQMIPFLTKGIQQLKQKLNIN